MAALPLRQEPGVEFVVKVPHPTKRRRPATGRLTGNHRSAHHRERGLLPGGGTDELSDGPGLGPSVGVQKNERVAGRALEHLAQRPGLAAPVWLDHDSDTRLFVRERPSDLHRSVGAPARHDPDLAPLDPRGELLVDERPDRGA